MILRNFISLRAFTVYMENSLRFEICTEVSFTTPEVMWTLIMKLPHTEVKFYPEVKSQTSLSSLRLSYKRARLHDTWSECDAYVEKYPDVKRHTTTTWGKKKYLPSGLAVKKF